MCLEGDTFSGEWDDGDHDGRDGLFDRLTLCSLVPGACQSQRAKGLARRLARSRASRFKRARCALMNRRRLTVSSPRSRNSPSPNAFPERQARSKSRGPLIGCSDSCVRPLLEGECSDRRGLVSLSDSSSRPVGKVYLVVAHQGRLVGLAHSASGVWTRMYACPQVYRQSGRTRKPKKCPFAGNPNTIPTFAQQDPNHPAMQSSNQ